MLNLRFDSYPPELLERNREFLPANKKLRVNTPELTGKQ
jgi:hypothetical protein